MAFYLFIQYECKIKSDIAKNIISFLAKHSYAVYLVHFSIGLAIVRRVVKVNNEFIYFLGHMVVCLAVSLLFAMLMNYIVVFPIQKYVKKRMLSYE